MRDGTREGKRKDLEHLFTMKGSTLDLAFSFIWDRSSGPSFIQIKVSTSW